VPDCRDLLALQTSIMAVTFDGGVVVGADSRVSTGMQPSHRDLCKAQLSFSYSHDPRASPCAFLRGVHFEPRV